MMTNKILIVASICLVVLSGISIYELNFVETNYSNLVENYNNLKISYSLELNGSKYDERCIMYNSDNIPYYEEANVNGLYFYSDQFYTVWTKDRTQTQIQATDYHENCHYLIDEDYEHFCGKDE